MSYQVFNNFKSGLDKRKMELSSDEGSLLVCKNAVINRGGEIEVAKDFVSKYVLETGLTFGLHAAEESLYCFGSGEEPATQPAGIIYQRLQHPTNKDMTKIISVENFDGKIYAIAEYSDDSKHHFYNGVRVTDWDDLNVVATSNIEIATVLKSRINSKYGFTATSTNEVVYVTGAANVDYTITGTAVNFGAIDDQTLTIAQTQAASAAVDEVLATSTFTVTDGTSGASNGVSTITVNGVDIFDGSGGVLWTTSHENTAALIAAEIIAQTSTPNYTATTDGADVTISAAVGTGATPNDFVVVVTTTGDVEVDSEVTGATTVAAMADGVTAVAALPEINTITIGGTFESADEFTVIVAGEVFKVSGNAGGSGTESLLTFNNKLYCTTASLLFFSEIGNPQKWGSDNGAGFINMSNQDAGSEVLSALGVYQNYITVFSKKSTQIWSVDPDPALNSQIQILRNIGCVSPKSVQSFGDNDMFFLSKSGIRSVRARNNVNTAGVSDVGTLIDDLLIADMKTLTNDQLAVSPSFIQPFDGRYWLAVGPKIYLFTYFPESKISAWTTLEPDLTITDFAIKDDRVYARSGDVIYLYGGDDDDEYTQGDVVIEFPFVNSRTIASFKSWTGLDFIVEGIWNVYFCTDFKDSNNFVKAGTIKEITIDEGDFDTLTDASAFKVKLELKNSGSNGKISAMIVHFDEAET